MREEYPIGSFNALSSAPVDGRPWKQRMCALMGHRASYAAWSSATSRCATGDRCRDRWPMLQPLLTMLVLHLVFSSFFRFAV